MIAIPWPEKSRTSGCSSCHEKAACLNGNKCVCLKGYTGNGKICKNENECENGKHNCIDPAICKKKIQKISLN